MLSERLSAQALPGSMQWVSRFVAVTCSDTVFRIDSQNITHFRIREEPLLPSRICSNPGRYVSCQPVYITIDQFVRSKKPETHVMPGIIMGLRNAMAKRVEPMAGLEPATGCLRNSCSTD